MADDLPPEDVQAALLDGLASLIERRGLEPFVAAPLLEADDRFFPDEWHANDASVARLATRLLAYAGLDSLEVVVELEAHDDDAPAAAVWFIGIDGAKCRFGTTLARLDDALLAVATIAHEVARAYRVFHQLDGADADPGSDLVSLTTIYLGFGILTTNASYRYRSKGELRGSLAYTEWSHQRFGGLSPQAMSFALAAQLAARDATSSQIRAVVAQLERNQRAYFEAAYGELMPDVVATRLGLADRATWPAPRPLPPKIEGKLVRSLAATAALIAGDLGTTTTVPRAEIKKGGTVRANEGRATFRVKNTATWTWFALGLVPALVVFVAVAALAPRFSKIIGWSAISFIVFPLVGLVLGRSQRRDYCSDPTCRGPLPQQATICARCGGKIAATLKHANERLDAEDRLRLNRDDYDMDVDAVSPTLEPGARPIFTPPGVAGGLIGAAVHQPDDDDEGTERGKSSTVV